MRSLLLIAVLATLFASPFAFLGCSERVHPPPAGGGLLPGIPSDAAVDTSDTRSVDTAVSSDAVEEAEVLDAESPCAAFCSCMAATCATEASYPFPSEGACLSWCSKLSDEERTCYAQFCAEAALTKAATIKTHDCDHATGAYGLAECT